MIRVDIYPANCLAATMRLRSYCEELGVDISQSYGTGIVVDLCFSGPNSYSRFVAASVAQCVIELQPIGVLHCIYRSYLHSELSAAQPSCSLLTCCIWFNVFSTAKRTLRPLGSSAASKQPQIPLYAVSAFPIHFSDVQLMSSRGGL